MNPKFDQLDLIEPILKAVREEGYETPTPIQAQAIPLLIEGRDVLGCAQTGTGKTAAFALPVLQRLTLSESQSSSSAPPPSSSAEEDRSRSRRPRRGSGRPGKRIIRALVLSPTRELIAQIGDNFESYSRHLDLKHLVIFGGVSATPQIEKLSRGVDVLCATPGRLLDLQNQGYIDLTKVEFFVLDEADRMLDMGFIHDIRKVLKVLPERRQNLLFSATMPPNIIKLASSFLDNPAHVEVVPESTTAERVEQKVMFVEKKDKRRLLAHLLSSPEVEQSIVFTRTKHGANRLVQLLEKAGHQAAAIHGNKSQNARTKALNGFREGSLPTLIATDIAARGIDVPGVSHVFNYDLPNEPESYVHRIGRTGRAGESGLAVAFCDDSEGPYLRSIERLIDQDIEVDDDHPWHFAEAIPPQRDRTRRGRRQQAAQGGQKNNQSRRGPHDRQRSGSRNTSSSNSGDQRTQEPRDRSSAPQSEEAHSRPRHRRPRRPRPPQGGGSNSQN